MPQKSTPTAQPLPAPAQASSVLQQANLPQVAAPTAANLQILLQLRAILESMDSGTYMDAVFAHQDDAVKFLKRIIKRIEQGKRPWNTKDKASVSLVLSLTGKVVD